MKAVRSRAKPEPARSASGRTLRDLRAAPHRAALGGLQRNLVEAIGSAIVGGEWSASSPLPQEAELLRRFGVSRPTLREAMRVLASKGLIESRQKIGTTVRPQSRWKLLDPDVLGWLARGPIDPSTGAELVAFRRMIEPQVARLAAGARASREALRAAFEAMSASRHDKVAYYMADRAFHAALFEATGNRFVEALGRTVMVVLDFSFSLQSRSLIDPERGLVLHGEALAAIVSNDPDAAEKALLRLLGEAERELARSRRTRAPRQR